MLGAPTMGLRIHTAVISLGLVVPAGACTRSNAEFGGTEGAGTTKGGSSSTVAVDTSSGPGEVDGTGSTGSADTLDSTTEADETTGGYCPLHEPAPIEIEVFENDSNTPLMPSPACDDVLVIDGGQLVPTADGLVVRDCPKCLCEKAPPSPRLALGGTLVVPPLEQCMGLVVWAAEGPDGCRWDGFALGDPGTLEIPVYLAMSSRSLPVDEFGVVVVELEPEQTCVAPVVCAEEPGTHALSFFGGPPVSVGTPEEVTIGFFASVDYTVTNRMASVDLDCHEHVAWTALRVP